MGTHFLEIVVSSPDTKFPRAPCSLLFGMFNTREKFGQKFGRDETRKIGDLTKKMGNLCLFHRTTFLRVFLTQISNLSYEGIHRFVEIGAWLHATATRGLNNVQ